MNSRNEYPSPDELLPHSGSMNLLDGVLEHNREETLCTFSVSRDHLMCRDGEVPPWFGIEFMGQCSHCHYLLNARDEDTGGKNALFLSARRVRFSTTGLKPDTEYTVYAREFGSGDRFFSSENHIRPETSGEKVIEGRLSALILKEGESVTDTLRMKDVN